MAVFLLTTNDSDIQQNTLDRLQEKYAHKILSSKACLISSKDMTSTEVSQDLFMDDNAKRYLLVKCVSYYGLQVPDIWEWMTLQDNDE